jgi:predicted kinase
VIVAMVGLPRSGKTMIINKLYKPMGFIVVCPDEMRHVIHGQDFIASAEPFIWASVYACVDMLCQEGYDIVIDATNVSKKRREPWIARGAYFHLVTTHAEECILRAGTNDALIDAIKRMAMEWTYPEDRLICGRDLELVGDFPLVGGVRK